MEYQVKLQHQDDGEILVTCADFPEMSSIGNSEEEALNEAADAIQTTLQMYIQDRRAIPVPSGKRKGTRPVNLPAMAVLKVGIYELMKEQGLRKADLARKLGIHMPQVDRLLDLRYSTKLDQLEKVIHALGRRMEVKVSEAA